MEQKQIKVGYGDDRDGCTEEAKAVVFGEVVASVGNRELESVSI